MKNHVFSMIAIAVLGGLIYSGTLDHSFHFDDYYYITDNLHIRDIGELAHLGKALPSPSRYVPFLTFALNYRLHGLDVTGYHVVNIVAHILTGLAVYWLTLLLLSSPRLKQETPARHKELVAFVSAVLFISHPLQTQAVTYVCQRFTVMATMFYVTAICFYLKGREATSKASVYFVAAALSAVLGMFSKQIVLTLPVAILLIEWLFFNRARRMKWKYVIPVMLFVLIIPAIYKFNIRGILSMQTESWSHRGDLLTSSTYFLTQIRVLVTYIKLLFFPYEQNLLYDFPMTHNLFEIPTVLSLLLLLFILREAWSLRDKFPLIAFGVFWFFLTLTVESSVIVIKHVIFEHRCYLPSVGFSVSVTAALFRSVKDRKKFMTAITVIVLVLSYLTVLRNSIWKDEKTLWSDVIKKSPDKTRPYTHLATAYMNEGATDLALIEFTRAIETNPADAQSYNNRGNAYVKMGQEDLALADYNKALSLDPGLEKTYSNRGIIYSRRGEYGRALADLDMAVRLGPQNATAYFNRGNLFLKLRNYDRALNDYATVLELNPYDSAAYNQRGVVYGTIGQFDRAVEEFTKAVGSDPRNPKIYWHRSLTYRAMGEHARALEDALKADSLGRAVDPDYIQELRSKIKSSN